MVALFHKAERRKARLRLGIAGPAGSGKSYSALLIAFGIGGRVAVIDTENGSGELYAHLGDYDVCTITAPFLPEKYIEAIKTAEEAGYNTIIIDSLSHAWSGEGGLLDTHSKITEASKSGNSWAAWRKVTPMHNALVEAILQSKCHVIATMRSKMEYTQVEEGGSKVVKRLGMAPIQREGMEYEFTAFFDLSQDHVATATKDRTTLFDGKYFKPTQETGKVLLTWLESGVDTPAPTPVSNSVQEAKQTVKKQRTPEQQAIIDETKAIIDDARKRGVADEEINMIVKLLTGADDPKGGLKAGLGNKLDEFREKLNEIVLQHTEAIPTFDEL